MADWIIPVVHIPESDIISVLLSSLDWTLIGAISWRIGLWLRNCFVQKAKGNVLEIDNPWGQWNPSNPLRAQFTTYHPQPNQDKDAGYKSSNKTWSLCIMLSETPTQSPRSLAKASMPNDQWPSRMLSLPSQPRQNQLHPYYLRR